MFVYDARRSVKKKRSRAPPLAQFVNVAHDINLEKNEAVYVNIRLTFSRRNFLPFDKDQTCHCLSF
jgi:hypothetical protein